MRANEAGSILEDAKKSQCNVVANLALLEYDKQVNILFESFLKQQSAVSKCDAFARIRRVDEFEVKFSSPERANAFFASPSRHCLLEPDLSILALNVDDLPPAENQNSAAYDATVYQS